VLEFNQLQRLITTSRFPQAVTSGMDLVRFVELLHHFSLQHHAFVITRHLDTIVVATQGSVSTTTDKAGSHKDWAVATAAHAAVWWLQNPSKPFEAITTSLTHEALR
jgi:hypothetical protein